MTTSSSRFDISTFSKEKISEIQNQLQEIKHDTNDQIADALQYNNFTYFSEEELQELRKLINDNKLNNTEGTDAGMPTGTISFQGQKIDLDTILNQFPDIKNAYKTALNIQDEGERNQALEEVNDKLIQGLCIIYAEHYPEETRINGKKMNDKEDQLNQGFERLLVSRDNTADQLEKKQIFSDSPSTKINLNNESNEIDLSRSPYKEIIDSYKKEFQEAGENKDQQRKVYTKIAEQIILKSGLRIQINNQHIKNKDTNYKSAERLDENLQDCKNGLTGLNYNLDAITFSKPGKKYRIIRDHVETGKDILSKLSNRDMVATHLDHIMKGSGDEKKLEIRGGNDHPVTIDLTSEEYNTIFEDYKRERNAANNEDEKIKINTRYAEYLILKAGCYIQINNDQIDSSNPNHKNTDSLDTNLNNCKDGLNDMKRKPFGNFEVDSKHRTINGKEYRYIYPRKEIKEEKPEDPTPNTDNHEKDNNKKDKKNTLENSSEKVRDLLGILTQFFAEGITDKNLNEFISKLQADDQSKKLLKSSLQGFKDKKLTDDDFKDMHDIILRIINNGASSSKETLTENAEIKRLQEENAKLKQKIEELMKRIENLTNEIHGNKGGIEQPGEGSGTKPETKKSNANDEADEVNLEMIEESSEISDQRTSIEDLVKKEVRDAMNNEYHNLKRYNLGKKLKFFCARGRIEKKRIAEEMKKHKRTAFTRNDAIDAERSAQASRHDLEEKNQGSFGTYDTFGEITRTKLTLTEIQQTELNHLCVCYINDKIPQGYIAKDRFKLVFNDFLKRIGLPEENQYLGANILDKLDTIKAEKELGGEIATALLSYVSASDETTKRAHRTTISKLINDYFEKNKKEPRFMKLIEEITHGKDEKEQKEKIAKFLKHRQALEKLSLKNFTMKLDLLTNGKGAYEMNNKSHKNRFTKLGARFDNLPLYGRIGVMATTAGIGIGTGLLRGAWAATGALAGIAGTRAAAKRANQYRIEQENHKDNTAKNYEEARRKEEALQAIINDPDAGRFKKIKAKREQKRYKNTTQTELDSEKADTQELTKSIFYIGQNYNTDTMKDRKKMANGFILDARARYKAYKKKGQNFLHSKKKEDIEKDMNNLLQSLMFAAKKITKNNNATLRDLETLPATEIVEEIGPDGQPTGNVNEQPITFKALMDRYEKNADEALKAYKRRRALTALKSGAITAGSTLATSLGIQAFSGSGVFASEGQAAIPGTADRHSHELITDNGEAFQDQFDLGDYLNGGNNIHNAAATHLNTLGENDVVTIHIGSGTDATPVRIGSDLAKPETLQKHMNNVIQTIQNSNIANKDELITELNYLTPQGSGMSHTNQQLRKMRWLTVVKDTIKGAPDFTGSLHVSPDSSLDIAGTHLRHAAERIAQAKFEINHLIPGTPETPAVEGGKERFVVGLQPFSNIFEAHPENEEDKGEDKIKNKKEEKSDPKIKDNTPEPTKPTDNNTPKKDQKVVQLNHDLSKTTGNKGGTASGKVSKLPQQITNGAQVTVKAAA